MFCTKCGKKIEDTAKFCQFCGTKISINRSDEKKSEDNIPLQYIWGYKFTETDLNNLSVLRHYIEAKGDYYLAEENLQEKKIYFYKSTKVSKPPVIIIYKQGDEVMIFGNEAGYISVRSRFLNKNFKKIKKEQINFKDIDSKDVRELITQNELAPGKEDAGLTGVSGWLALFILGIFATSAMNIIWSLIDFTSWGLIDLAIGVYGVYVGYLLVKVKPHAIINAKIYLAVEILLGVALLILYYSYSLDDETLTDAWRIIFYGAIWLSYFSSSKRVKSTYIN